MCVRVFRFNHNSRTVEVTAHTEAYAKEEFQERYGYWPQESISSVPLADSRMETNEDDYSWAPYV